MNSFIKLNRRSDYISFVEDMRDCFSCPEEWENFLGSAWSAMMMATNWKIFGVIQRVINLKPNLLKMNILLLLIVILTIVLIDLVILI